MCCQVLYGDASISAQLRKTPCFLPFVEQEKSRSVNKALTARFE